MKSPGIRLLKQNLIAIWINVNAMVFSITIVVGVMQSSSYISHPLLLRINVILRSQIQSRHCQQMMTFSGARSMNQRRVSLVADAYAFQYRTNGRRIHGRSSGSSLSGGDGREILQRLHRHHSYQDRHHLKERIGMSLSSDDEEELTSQAASVGLSDQQGQDLQLLLTKHLAAIIGHSETQLLTKAMWENLQDPLKGYDQRFGRPAIKTYRAFVFPKKTPKTTKVAKLEGMKTNQSDGISNDVDENDDGVNTDVYAAIQLDAAAGRCARQIDFLIKRHRSHEADWIRHHDPVDTRRKTNEDDQQDNSHAEESSSLSLSTRRTFPITLVLDNLRSAMNVGSIFRSAETTGCCQVLTCGITPHPGGSGCEKLSKAALGADRLVPTRHYPTTQSAIDELLQQRQDPQNNNNIFVAALETTDRSILYSDLDYRLYYNGHRHERGSVTGDMGEHHALLGDSGPDAGKGRLSDRYNGIALVLGNEVTGVDTKILEMVDEIVELPTFGVKNSLNVASCAPVVIYEILRQWNVDK